MSVFEANLREIVKQSPELAAALCAAQGGRLEIRPTKSGHPTGFAQGRAIHSTYDPLKESTSWAAAQIVSCREGDVVLVFVIGLLYHVEALCKVLPPSIRLVVAVPDLVELHDACAVRAWGDWAKRVTWVWGVPHSMARRTMEFGSSVRLMTYVPAARLHPDAHAAIEESLRRSIAHAAGGQLRIAVVGPIYGGSLPVTRSVVTALESLGHRVDWIDHSAHATSYQALARLKDARHRQVMQNKFAEFLSQLTLVRIAERPPDLVLALAQAPMTLSVLEHVRKKHFLTAMWFVENYRHLTYWQQMATGFDFWFVNEAPRSKLRGITELNSEDFSEGEANPVASYGECQVQKGGCLDAFRHAGAKEIHYLPMAADLTAHKTVSLTSDEMEEFGADVSFVGAGYANRREILPQVITPEWRLKVWGNEWDGATAIEHVLQRGGRG